jgi:endonuclease-3
MNLRQRSRAAQPGAANAGPREEETTTTVIQLSYGTRPAEGPDHQVIREVRRRLRAQQGEPGPRQPVPVLDQVVGTVLSQHTSDVNSGRAFAQLKALFPDWEQAAHAPAGEVEETIRCGGLARQKARRIKEILDAVGEREGRADLGRLHDLDDRAAEDYLTSLPGVGVKTAACVLAFSMGRAAFPVDTHVHRVVTRLGWVPAGATADKAYRLLAPRVPAGIRYDLHLALIRHGRTVPGPSAALRGVRAARPVPLWPGGRAAASGRVSGGCAHARRGSTRWSHEDSGLWF